MSEMKREENRYNKKYLQKQLAISVLSTAGVYIGFKYFLPLFLPFIFSYLFAKLLLPIVKLLKYKFRLPTIVGSVLSIILCFSILGCFFGYLGCILTRELKGFLSDIPLYADALFTSFDSICSHCDRMFGLENGCASMYLQKNVSTLWGLVQNVVMPVISEHTINLFVGMVGMLSLLLIIVIGIINIIIDYDDIKSRYTNSELYKCISPVTSKLGNVGIAYVKTQATIMCINSIILVAGFYIINNKYALLVGIVIAIMDAFPVIGSGLFLVPMSIIKLLGGHFFDAVIVLLLYGLCEMVRSIIEPKILGDRIGLKPIFTLIAMFVGFRVFGLLGFLMGPLGLVIIKTILEENRCMQKELEENEEA